MKLSELFFPAESRQEPRYTLHEVDNAQRMLLTTDAAVYGIEKHISRHIDTHDHNYGTMRTSGAVGSTATERVVEVPTPELQPVASVTDIESYRRASARQEEASPSADNDAYIAYITAQPEQEQSPVQETVARTDKIAAGNDTDSKTIAREKVEAAFQQFASVAPQYPIELMQGDSRYAQEAA